MGSDIEKVLRKIVEKVLANKEYDITREVPGDFFAMTHINENWDGVTAIVHALLNSEEIKIFEHKDVITYMPDGNIWCSEKAWNKIQTHISSLEKRVEAQGRTLEVFYENFHKERHENGCPICDALREVE